MTNDQNDTDRGISSFPPRSAVHGGTGKKRKEHLQEQRNKNGTVESKNVQENDDEVLENDSTSEQVEETTTYAYRRPERKRPKYLLVKIWLVLFLMIVIGMVTFPLWQDWLTLI
ncbi:hypothetical protein [Salisediminibacterium beveridgei]|uniref:Uncharacterized protein n=1 Tax=Salisediminibacterium beveridgei TaxID=632773 RepID=A0A1D7QUT0_9BACI|nr:hypothetical protein [Salisediminibacterium beveridgei]AOM82774.1 hypothetical protein BBEV_1411 [Salisediminibacterium beveridgei]